MKFTVTVAALAVSVGALASFTAQAILEDPLHKGSPLSPPEHFKSLKQCSDYAPDDWLCKACCNQFGCFPAMKRWLMFTPVHQCKCITRDERDKLVDKERAKHRAPRDRKPLYKSVKSCSDYLSGVTACWNCCDTFGKLPSSSMRSEVFTSESVCTCVDL